MTHPHPQPKRCIHECVCHSYLDYQSDDLDPCLAKKCEHDTRTHIGASQQRIDAAIKELEKARTVVVSPVTNWEYVDDKLVKAIALLQAGERK